MRENPTTRLAWLLSIIMVAIPLHAASHDFLLSSGNAGPVKIGMSIDELYSKINRKRTRLVDTFDEGYFTPTLQIFLPGNNRSKPSMQVEIVCRCGNPVVATSHPRSWYAGTPWGVGRITVYDPRFHTASGIHVGSTLGEIRKAYHFKILNGEGRIGPFVKSLDMTFFLSSGQAPRAWYTTHNDATIPNGIKVASILIVQ